MRSLLLVLCLATPARATPVFWLDHEDHDPRPVLPIVPWANNHAYELWGDPFAKLGNLAGRAPASPRLTWHEAQAAARHGCAGTRRSG